MHLNKLRALLMVAGLINMLGACSKHDSGQASPKNILNVDLGADVATLDPQLAEDVQSTRVAYDLFEGLLSQSQTNKAVAGLAEKWEISPDGKTYTFHLRDGLKFSDGSAITTKDIIFSFQRLADPKVASPYNYLVSNIVNGQKIIDGKAAATTLAIQAIDAKSVQINLEHPDPSFLAICTQPELAIVSEKNLTQFGNAWTQPKNMLTSGAYKLDERVVQGYILISKNPYYYAAKDVAIPQVKFFPIVDFSSSLSLYKSGDLDMTYSLPVDQYKAVKAQMPKQEHSVSWETIEYYDFNMNSAKFKNNLKLRQALSMAVDRQTLVNSILGQGQKALYAYATSTIEGGKFSGLDYDWASLPRAEQVAQAQQLFKAAGYGPDHPLQITISFNTKDLNKKNVLALASMWQDVFGAKSIQVIAANQEWKTFLRARHTGNYEIARDGWVADYDSIDSYSALYQCGNPQNNSKGCSAGYNDLLTQAQNSDNPELRVKLLRQALQSAMANYTVIPLYQGTYYRLVNPKVKGYAIENNHLDHVISKWFKF